MKYIRTTFSAFFALVFLGGLGLGGYFVSNFILAGLARMDFQVAAITLTGSAVAFLVALIMASSIRHAGRQSKVNPLQAEKVATYQFLADLWQGLLQPGRGREDGSPSRLSEERQALDCLLSLYASPGVIKTYAILRALERESGGQHPNAMAQFANVLLEVRKDLGAEVKGLTAEALLQLFLADSAKVTAPVKTSAYHNLHPRISLSSPQEVR